MLSRHIFCCYMCLPNALLLRECRLQILSNILSNNLSIYWLFLFFSYFVIFILLFFLFFFFGGLRTHVSRVRISGIAWFFFHFFFFIFYVFVIIITVQICKFNITVSTQILLLYYPLWCPGLQRLQRFDLYFLVMSSDPYFNFISGLYLSNYLKYFNDTL